MREAGIAAEQRMEGENEGGTEIGGGREKKGKINKWERWLKKKKKKSKRVKMKMDGLLCLLTAVMPASCAQQVQVACYEC